MLRGYGNKDIHLQESHGYNIDKPFEQFEVAEILDHRLVVNEDIELRVKWKNFNYSTWEAEKQVLTTAPKKVLKYYADFRATQAEAIEALLAIQNTV